MAKAPVDVATPKLELVTCVKKWMSRIADGVDRVWMMLLLDVSTEFDRVQAATLNLQAVSRTRCHHQLVPISDCHYAADFWRSLFHRAEHYPQIPSHPLFRGCTCRLSHIEDLTGRTQYN